MKGKISLVDFIKEVKSELRAAVDNESPFFEMGEVELEVTFSLDISGKAGVKLIVAELGGSTKASQTHKVKLKLHPFVTEEEPSQVILDSQQPNQTVRSSSPPRVSGSPLPHTTNSAPNTRLPRAKQSNSRPTALKIPAHILDPKGSKKPPTAG